MLLGPVLTLILGGLLVTAAPHAPRQAHAYDINFRDTQMSPGAGIPTGCCTLYNFTAIPDGQFTYEATVSVLDAPATVGFNQVYRFGTRCLDAGSSPRDGTPVTFQACRGGLGQDWIVGDGRVRLDGTEKCLDVPDGNIYHAKLQVWSCHDDGDPDRANQRWTTQQIR